MRKTNVFVCQQQRHFNQSVRPTLDVYGCKRKKKKFWTKTDYTCLVVSFVFLFLRKENYQFLLRVNKKMAFLLFILLTGLIKLFTLLYKYSVEKKDDTTRKAI